MRWKARNCLDKRRLRPLGIGFVFALLGIYGLLAVPFRSYFQPVLVMLSIPFGIIGALLGLILLGHDLSVISLFGIVALSGVVINDSLVLIVTANSPAYDAAALSQRSYQSGRDSSVPADFTDLADHVFRVDPNDF